MSEADEMLSKIGFNKKGVLLSLKGKMWGVRYTNEKEMLDITFDYIDKEVCISTSEDFNRVDTERPVYICMNGLKAIYEKCKELEWLDE